MKFNFKICFHCFLCLSLFFSPLSPSVPLSDTKALAWEHSFAGQDLTRGNPSCAETSQPQKWARYELKYRWGEPRSHLWFQPTVFSPDHSKGRTLPISCLQLSKSRRCSTCSGKPQLVGKWLLRRPHFLFCIGRTVLFLTSVILSLDFECLLFADCFHTFSSFHLLNFKTHDKWEGGKKGSGMG